MSTVIIVIYLVRMINFYVKLADKNIVNTREYVINICTYWLFNYDKTSIFFL